jgi:biotin operon repressor
MVSHLIHTKFFSLKETTIYDYLPTSEEFVRVRICSGSKQTPTQLVKVKELAEIVARNPLCKISVSYAAMAGGQTSGCVKFVVSICIDLDLLDGYATEEKIEAIRQRFPYAGIIISNGVTLIYKLKQTQTWTEVVTLAVAIGEEAARLTGLEFDRGTLLCKDGTPARHENHLFRFVGGYASRRECPVSFIPPLSIGGIEDDASGLKIKVNGAASIKKALTNKLSLENEGSHNGQHKLCSRLLQIRHNVLREGGTLGDAIKSAVSETGIEETKIQALYFRPGYEPIANKKKKPKRFKDDSDQGVIGIESSSRRYQKSRTWWSNFGHSVQSFWDLGWSVKVAYQLVISERDFVFFLFKFKQEYPANWPQILMEELDNLYEKFGKRSGLKTASSKCKEKVLLAINEGCVNAPQISKKTGYCEKQIKRALKVLKEEGKVTDSGRNKGKVWSLLSGHTKGIKKEEGENEDSCARVALVSFPVRTKNQLVKLKHSKWHRPKGCPVSTKEQRAEWKESADKLIKNEKTNSEIRALGLEQQIENWWVDKPVQFRRLKSKWGFIWQQYKKGIVNEMPTSLHEFATRTCGIEIKTTKALQIKKMKQQRVKM